MKTETSSKISRDEIAEELLFHKKSISAEYGNDVRKLAEALRKRQIGNPLIVSPPTKISFAETT
jgi:hypothetical protein